MLAYLVFVMFVCCIPFAAYGFIVLYLVNKRLSEHQKEWDAIKANTPPDEVLCAYNKYIDVLWENRHPVLGACFPKE